MAEQVVELFLATVAKDCGTTIHNKTAGHSAKESANHGITLRDSTLRFPKPQGWIEDWGGNPMPVGHIRWRLSWQHFQRLVRLVLIFQPYQILDCLLCYIATTLHRWVC